MAMHDAHHPSHHSDKSLAETALCFACAIGVLAAVALSLQWVLGFIS